jgi:zinc D-Ala-D-Ala dipeptidase
MRRVLPLLALTISCAGTPTPAVLPTASDAEALRRLAPLDPAIRQEVRYAGSNNFTWAPLPGYDQPIVLLRREAAAALGRVQARLAREGLGLKVFDGYRPVRATLAMVAWAERVGRTDLLDDGYIARRSRHNQGVAVDLTLVDLATGVELPMGTPYDEFSGWAHTANASGTVAANRQRLVAAMAAEGFVNYENEWWHFSFTVSHPVSFDLPLSAWIAGVNPR